MYAIVDVKDKQFKVQEDDTLYVPYHADAEPDDELTLDRVLLVSDGDGTVSVGTPTVEGATVTARVLDHVKGDKVLVFKKKRRKRYRVKRGHRQQYTQLRIEALHTNGSGPADASDTDDAAPTDDAALTAEEAPADAAAESADDTASEADAADANDAPEAEASAEAETDADGDSDDGTDEANSKA
jgi:large subunit ribosomal protein L21